MDVVRRALPTTYLGARSRGNFRAISALVSGLCHDVASQQQKCDGDAVGQKRTGVAHGVVRCVEDALIFTALHKTRRTCEDIPISLVQQADLYGKDADGGWRTGGHLHTGLSTLSPFTLA